MRSLKLANRFKRHASTCQLTGLNAKLETCCEGKPEELQSCGWRSRGREQTWLQQTMRRQNNLGHNASQKNQRIFRSWRLQPCTDNPVSTKLWVPFVCTEKIAVRGLPKCHPVTHVLQNKFSGSSGCNEVKNKASQWFAVEATVRVVLRGYIYICILYIYILLYYTILYYIILYYII